MKKWIILSALLLAGCSDKPSTLYDNKDADILFDASHGQTAGEADWVIDGGFSSFNDALLKKQYKTTSTNYNDEFTYEKLKHYKVVIIPEPNIPFKVEEQDALKRYVKEGGSVMFIADHYNADRNLNRFDSSEIFNGYRRGAFNDITKGMFDGEKQSERMKNVKSSDFLAETFGVRFRYNALNNVVIKTDSTHDAFNLLKGVKRVNMHAGSTIAITNPDIAKGIIYPGKLTSRDKWPHAVDDGVYSNGGTDEGAFVAISKYNKGKAVFIGDSSIIEDDTPKYVREDNGNGKNTYDGFNEADHKTLLNNLVDWLAKQEDYTSLREKTELDQKTPLLKMEIPEQSKELTREPWRTPSYGYLWYDPSTFKKGSFGASSTSNKEADSKADKPSSNVRVEAPSSVRPRDYIKIDVYHNEALQDVSVELIDANGAQVGLFNGRPPGKSDAFDMKRESNRYHCYFNGKIAREASQSIQLNIYRGGQLIETKNIKVKG